MTSTASRIIADRPASQQDGNYPRPTLVREHWCDLDRQVGFCYDDQMRGIDEHWERDPGRFDRIIQLPFPPESEASGINDLGFHPCLWYRIPVSAADLHEAGHASGRRLLLNFGAVDYEADVWVDGHYVGHHTGGQTAFSFDITSALDGAAEHVIVVRTFEDPQNMRQPRGKQDWHEQPHVIWYHRTSGIWRSVWLESVPDFHVTRLVWRSDLQRAQATALIEFSRRPEAPVEVEVVIHGLERDLARSVVTVDDQAVEVRLNPAHLHSDVEYDDVIWRPGYPMLLDSAVVVHGPGGDDEIGSYLGFREVGVSEHSLLLNHRPFRLSSVLEQGFWPASHLTPPSRQALRDEVQLILDLGFNSARIHQKVEDPRFFFWADKLGLTLWGETAAAYTFDSPAIALLSKEWIDIVRQYESHPSIIAWVPFNESWGVPQAPRDASHRAYSRALADLARALDPTRPVISNDGWEHAESDLITVHDYEGRRGVLERRYCDSTAQELLDGPSPNTRPLFADPGHRRDLPILVTECGGVEYLPQARDDHWGYTSASDPADYEHRIREIMTAFKASPFLAGWCWTQLTDTLQETNGLCDEARVPKIPAHIIKELMQP